MTPAIGEPKTAKSNESALATLSDSPYRWIVVAVSAVLVVGAVALVATKLRHDDTVSAPCHVSMIDCANIGQSYTPAPPGETTTNPTAAGSAALTLPVSARIETTNGGGDRLVTELGVAPPVPASDAAVPAKSSCYGMDSRAVAIRVEGLVTLQSQVKTGKAVVHLSMAPLSVPTDFAIKFGDGSEHCYPPADDNGNRAIAFSSLSPGEPNTFVFWIVVLNAVTPNHPNGNPDVVNVALNPQIELATSTTAKLSGSRVLFCNGEYGSPVVALGPDPYSCSDGSTGSSTTPLPVTTRPIAQRESPSTTAPSVPTTPSTATAVAYPIIGGPADVRIKPDLSATSIATLENGTPVRITCTATGSSVTGPGNITSNVWDRLELSGGYVPDVYVRTGTTDRVAPPC